MESILGFCQNKLLETLPSDDSVRILKNMDLVQIYAGEALYESGEKTQAAYFPIYRCCMKLKTAQLQKLPALVMTELWV